MKTSRHLRQAAFTLIEAMIAIGIFGVYAGVGVTAMVRMNSNAALSRLQTGASTLAQGQIDLCLSDQPFNPQYSQIPPELALTAALPNGVSTYYGNPQVNSGTSTAPAVPVYTDPTTGNTVLGWMTTAVTNANAKLGAGSNDANAALYIYQITVTVSYNYRNKTRSVTMCTLRASDS
jgi:type II secretory pathway pseudopilin PulG